MTPGDRRCELCRHVAQPVDVGPGLLAVDQGGGRLRYRDVIRCRDRAACRRRAELAGRAWPVVESRVTA